MSSRIRNTVKRARLIGSPTYYERFHEAFVNEVNTFTEAVLDDKRES